MTTIKLKAENVGRELYIGDSVYLRFLPYGVELTTRNGYVDDPRNIIILEPDIAQRLVQILVNGE